MTWWLASVFRARFPDVRLDETKMLVRDDPCLTAGSAYAQLDLTLAVALAVSPKTLSRRCGDSGRAMLHADGTRFETNKELPFLFWDSPRTIIGRMPQLRVH